LKILLKRLGLISLLFILVFVLTVPDKKAIFGQPLVPARPVSVYFEYSMQDRFGMDSNGDGLVDHNYSPNYVDPPSGYPVNFDGCASSSGGRSPIVSYTWEIAYSHRIMDSSCKQTINLREGVHPVTLTITLQDGQTYSKTERIAVEDILIVSIGDSFSAGEGNPDRAQRFDVSGQVVSGPVWQDRQCHRSTTAYPAQAASEIERSDPRTSVTFLSYSCSGAGLEKGLLDQYEGIEPEAGQTILAQTWLVSEAVDDLTVDILMISAGGNDIGFSGIIKGCILVSCNTDTRIRDNLNLAFSRLPELYDRLAGDIESKFNASNIIISEYPDPTRNRAGSYCSPLDYYPEGSIFEAILPEEWKWAYENVLTRLNQEVKSASERNGWIYVGDIASQSRTHGYCAQDQRWFRTFEDARNIQGPFGRPDKSTGTMHPNPSWHMSLKGTIVPHLQSLAGPPKMHTSVEPYSITNRVQETFTVRTEDTRLHKPVDGVIIVGNEQVGTTNTPFTYTFNATTFNNGFKVVSPNYADVLVPVSITFPSLQVSPQPPTIGLGRQVTVTIFTTDGATGEPVNGKIFSNEGFPRLNRPPIGDTNVPFAHTFHMASRPATEEERGEDGQPRFVHEFPAITVVAPGHETTQVHIVFHP
jgi:hypothetical protein